MIRYFIKALRSHVRSSRSLYILTVLGVALGVASVLCIQILNANALSAFVGSVKAISGDADISLFSRTPALDETIFPRVLADPDVESAWPLYRIDVNVSGRDDLFLEVVGLDLFAAASLPFGEEEDQGGRSAGEDRGTDDGAAASDPQTRDPELLAAFLSVPGWVAVTPSLAGEMGWSVGDTVEVNSGSRRAELQIGALVDFQRYSPLAPRKIAVMDIAQAQSLLGRPGEIHQIDIRLAPGADVDATMRRLEQRLGPAVQALTPEQRKESAAGFIDAFRLNLTALSLISLFVGIFLIYGSVQASLVRRRSEFGLLRCLGATSRQILGIILGETVLLGLVGVAIGIPLGYWAARLNVGLVSSTLSNIYLLEEIETLRFGWQFYLLAAGIGIGGALLGSLQPGLDMARRDTGSLLKAFTLHEKASRLAPRLAVAALIVGLAGLIWFAAVGRTFIWGGFVLGVVVMVSLPLLTPLFIRLFCSRIRARGLGLAYSMKNLVLKLQNSSVAVAALGIAVTMLIGITIMIGSFRQTLDTWISTALNADIYVTTMSWARAGREAYLTPELLEGLTTHPGVENSVGLRRFFAYAGERRIVFSGIDYDPSAVQYELPLKEGPQGDVLRQVLEEGAAVIGEPLARKAGLGVGDILTVTGPDGPAHFPVAGVRYDYSSESGSAFVHLDELERVFGPGPINNVALYLEPGVDAETVADELKARYGDVPLNIRSNRRLREEVLQLFDQTFAVTRILQTMALIIAAAGISLSLLIQARERVAELALYRSLGTLRPQIFKIFLGEGLSMGILGLALGFVGGLGLAMLLIYVINPAYFGWTIHPAWSWADVGIQAATIIAASVLAGIYPALQGSRVLARELSREDL